MQNNFVYKYAIEFCLVEGEPSPHSPPLHMVKLVCLHLFICFNIPDL